MPYSVKKKGGAWVVVNPQTGKVYGKHASRRKALAQLAALYAQAPPGAERSLEVRAPTTP